MDPTAIALLLLAASPDAAPQSPPNVPNAGSITFEAPCGPAEQVNEHIKSAWGETLRSAALLLNHGNVAGVLQIWRKDNGNLTIIATLPDGRSCLVAAGAQWQDVDSSDEPQLGPPLKHVEPEQWQ